MGGPQVRIPSSVCLHVNQDGSKGTAARTKNISSDFRPRSEEARPANKTEKTRAEERGRERERERQREREREREREKEIRFAKSDERSETGTENKHAGSGC